MSVLRSARSNVANRRCRNPQRVLVEQGGDLRELFTARIDEVEFPVLGVSTMLTTRPPGLSSALARPAKRWGQTSLVDRACIGSVLGSGQRNRSGLRVDGNEAPVADHACRIASPDAEVDNFGKNAR